MGNNFINKYDIIIFDCDGVLIDVNNLKVEAFGKAVEEYPIDVVSNFIDYCKNTFGVSRYVKFRDFFSDYAKEPFQEDKYNKYICKYAEICNEIYQSAELTPDCEELLLQLKKYNKQLYIASGSDENELNKVLKDRNVSYYFNKIYGSPKTKSESVTEILNNHSSCRGILIGDALSDLATAQKHNLDFIYMYSYSIQSKELDQQCRDGAVKVISTLSELLLEKPIDWRD